jgi:hypothetical protein
MIKVRINSLPKFIRSIRLIFSSLLLKPKVRANIFRALMLTASKDDKARQRCEMSKQQAMPGFSWSGCLEQQSHHQIPDRVSSTVSIHLPTALSLAGNTVQATYSLFAVSPTAIQSNSGLSKHHAETTVES